jgi:hypothetical protein
MSRYIREPKGRSFERVGGLKTRDTAVGGMCMCPVPSRRAARAGHDNVVPCNVREKKRETMSKNSCEKTDSFACQKPPLSRVSCKFPFAFLVPSKLHG